MHKEKLSAFMDGEFKSDDYDVFSSFENNDELCQKWQNYHLIRDILKGDVDNVIHLNMSTRIATALEKEATYGEICSSELLEAQPHPGKWQQFSFFKKLLPWSNQLMQIGVAACVSLVIIFGVQQYNTNSPDTHPDIPMLNTMPIGGVTTPVSYGVPANINQGTEKTVEEQRQRINLMLQDYELQRRAQVNDYSEESSNAAIAGNNH